MDQREQGSPTRTRLKQDDFAQRIMNLPAGAGAKRERVSEVKGTFNPMGVTHAGRAHK
jgi:hypothetical protein